MALITASGLIDNLRAKGLKCSFAESLTGGMIACGIVDVPGASDVLDGSIVSYSDSFKINVLGVPSSVIEEKTAVSHDCAVAMAQGALRLSGADIAVSVTGYAGPGDGADGTPCGTVYIGFADRNGSGAYKHHFDGDRDEVRTATRDSAYSLVNERIALL
ncbi:MAG: CinA family protein [Clostridiales bacterium]|nr:CinA family protein [Clostridiales bacterium]